MSVVDLVPLARADETSGGVAPTGDELPGAGSPPRTGRWRRGRLGVVVPPLIVFVLFLGVWLVITYGVLSKTQRFLVPPPQDVLSVAFLTGDNLSELLTALWLSAKVSIIGLVVSIVVGVSGSVLMTQAAWLERSFIPYAVVLQTIPIVALTPLLGFWFGFGFETRVLVCVLISLFPIINNTLFGLLSADRGLHDLFSLHASGRWTRLVKLQLPAALPAIFSGLRIAAGSSVIGAVVADYFFRQGDPGIGSLIGNYQSRIQSEQLFGAVILASLFGLVVYWAFGLLSRATVGSWHNPTRGGRGSD